MTRQTLTERDGKRAHTFYPVLIIGAGESGIAMGCRLRQELGFHDFQIFDRQAGLGGTWWINRYPGVACDVPTALYSFSFAPNYVSKRLYPTGEEFVQYLQDVAAKYDLLGKIQLNTDVSELRYIEEDSEWEVTLSHLVPGTGDWSAKDRQDRVFSSGWESVYLKQEVVRAKIVVSCVGILVEPNPWPSYIPGRESFQGDVFHSARWRHDVDLNGKDIVVVGSGCSAAQVVPSLLKEPYQVKSLTQIMRSPPWVMPRLQEPFGEEKYARYAPTLYRYFPFLGYLFRIFLCVLVEMIWLTVFQLKNQKWRKAIEASTLKRTYELVPEKYHQLMTPNYPYACKRRVFDSAWLGSMQEPRFLLTNNTLKAVEGNELVFGPPVKLASTKMSEQLVETESRMKADVIILANGFEATQWLHPLPVYGRDGVSIHDVWKDRGGPQAYMGTAVDGFPNFFLICGPNTANGHHSLILATENMASYILKIMKPVLRGETEYIEVKKDAVVKWQEGLQRDMKKTVFVACTSWYMDEKGYNSTMYPRSQTEFMLRCMFPKYGDWKHQYKGAGELRNVPLKALIFSAAAVVTSAVFLLLKR